MARARPRRPSMSKAYRHEQILKLIRSHPVHSQTELGAALERRGLRTSQVTLSRDLRDLGLVKSAGGYVVVAPAGAAPAHEPGPAAELGRVLREFARDLRPAQNLVVIKTEPGAAPTVAAALDAENWREVVGSLAGDDTVLLISSDAAAVRRLLRRLRGLLAA